MTRRIQMFKISIELVVEEFKDKVMMNDDTHIKEINKGIKTVYLMNIYLDRE